MGYEISRLGAESPDNGRELPKREGKEVDADITGMNGLFIAMLKLLFFGVKPKDVQKDLYPGKVPPKAAPKIPSRPPKNDSPNPNAQVNEAYKRFRAKYPDGYSSKKDRFEFLNDDEGDERKGR